MGKIKLIFVLAVLLIFANAYFYPPELVLPEEILGYLPTYLQKTPFYQVIFGHIWLILLFVTLSGITTVWYVVRGWF